MKYLDCFSIIKLAITISILINVHPVIAQEKVKISSEEHFKILENKWECELRGEYVMGLKSQLVIESPVTTKNVTGHYINGWCPSEGVNFKGKVAKGRLMIVVGKQPGPCAGNRHIINFSLFKSSDESYSLKGIHKYTTQEGFSGTYSATCI